MESWYKVILGSRCQLDSHMWMLSGLNGESHPHNGCESDRRTGGEVEPGQRDERNQRRRPSKVSSPPGRRKVRKVYMSYIEACSWSNDQQSEMI